MNVKVCEIVLLFFGLGCGYEFPEAFERCHLSDPDLDSCLDRTIENAISLIGPSGIPSLNLLPIDPLRVSKIDIGAGSSAVDLHQKYDDVKVHGFSKLKVKNSHYDKSRKILTFTSVHPQIIQEANYDFNGKILVLPIYGKGKSNVTLDNWSINHTIKFEEKTTGGNNHLTITLYEIEVNTSKADFDFKNLFNGNKELSETIHKVLKENWFVIIDDIKEGIALAYQKVFQVLANTFLARVPSDEVFLP